MCEQFAQSWYMKWNELRSKQWPLKSTTNAINTTPNYTQYINKYRISNYICLVNNNVNEFILPQVNACITVWI